MNPFEKLFEESHPVFDGGIATELYERGFYINRPFEELNLTSSSDVQAVHEAYLKAGAQSLTTNSFSLTATQLKKFDLTHQQKALIIASIQNARLAIEKSGISARIGFSIGPLGVPIEPLGPTSKQQVSDEICDIARIIQSSSEKIDFYLLETFSSLDELESAIRGIRSVDDTTPIMASMTLLSSERNLIEQFAYRIQEGIGVSALGLNCGEGPNDFLEVLKFLKQKTKLPIIVQPNAGIPRTVNGRYFYMTSPDYLAKFAKRFVEAGAYGVGGCCGTGPAHIKAIHQTLKLMNARGGTQYLETSNPQIQIEISDDSDSNPVENPALTPMRWADRKQSKVGQEIHRNQKLISIELTSPKGTDIEKFLNAIRKVRDAGISFVNVPDGARASTRVSSLQIASYINSRFSEFQVTVIPHLTTRDRNLIALQSDLLGASVNQVHDLLLVTGDPPKLGNNKEATAVYDIDSIGLTYLVNSLNHGQSPRGEALGSRTAFGIGVAANPTAINLETELKRFRYKVESGADFAVTQPIYEASTYLNWRKATQVYSIPHIVGIWPFVSFKNADFMAHEVPGVHVPQWALERMQKYQDHPEKAVQEGIAISVELMKSIWSKSEGFAISAPLGKVDVALEVWKCLSKSV